MPEPGQAPKSGGSLRVLNSLVEARLGGPQIRSLNVARRLRDRDVETVFLVPTGTDEFADEAVAAGFEVRRVNFPRIRRPRLVGENVAFLTSFRRTVASVARVIDEEAIDVVHASMSTNLPTASACTRTDAALVWHLNATVLPWPLNRGVGYLARRWSDEIVVSSRRVREYYLPDATPTTTIYPPVDLERFDPDRVHVDEQALRADLGLAPETPVVGTVGNLNSIKGQDRLIRAVERVVDEWGEISVPLIGAELDSQRDYARRLRRLRDEAGLADAVEFVGWRSDVPELLALFDLFVCPSLTESGPMVVLEAMAMGCPVVTTDVGLVPEHFEDGVHARIVAPGDADALADAIESALSESEERAARAKRARRVVAESLSLKTAAERHLAAYQRTRSDGRG